tara:strand:- start:318 stop:488 length:171 start_codon:yes stop_codon:yes gene_type:complete
MIINKSIYLESGFGKSLSVCEMPEEFGISITEGYASLSTEEAEFLIEELTNFVKNK